ncbi:MAG: aldo/keto reductase [Lachnospiraceae bacterium]|nr:aldo/keto reductase [Lachnospiraceae bacterium]
MKEIVLGSTGIRVAQNALGALPIQRATKEDAVRILRKAYEGGMRYFDTARAYSDSEEKMGEAFDGMREKIYIATKTMAQTPEQFWKDLETSLSLLRTDYIDVYQFHCADRCFRPGDGTGMYECMQEAKAQGKIRHIGLTAHKIKIAMEAVESGLYETMQFPFSYLSGEQEIALVEACAKHNVGFVCMKGLAGGLITDAKAAMAFMTQYDNVLPIWGVQRESELDEWLAFMDETPEYSGKIQAFVEQERKELAGNFCRGCGYCEPCPVGIVIHQCARMSLMLRRMPSEGWLGEKWQQEMAKIDDCLHCNKCRQHCPYELNTPELLAANLDDYRKVLAGERAV